MKRIMILAAVAVFTMGCGSDDNGTSTSTEITGTTWKLTSLTSSQAYDGNDDGNVTTNLIAEAGCFDQSTLIFGSNNTLANNLSIPAADGCFPVTATGTYAQNGNTVSMTVTFDGETDTQNFVLNGNTLTTTVVDFYEIEVQVQGGQTVYESIDATMVYTKQ